MNIVKLCVDCGERYYVFHSCAARIVMTRRTFLMGVGAVAAVAALDKIGIGADDGFTMENLRYKCTERYVVGWSNSQGVFGRLGGNTLAEPHDLSAESLENMLIEIKNQLDANGREIRMLPNRMVIPTHLKSTTKWFLDANPDGVKLFSRAHPVLLK